MASSTEQEFIADYKAKLERFRRSQFFWSSKVASRIGEKMAIRLKEVRVLSVQIDAQEEPSSLSENGTTISVKSGGISIADAEDLIFLG